MIVAVPAAEHVAAAVDTVGVEGVVNCAVIEKVEEEKHPEAFVAVIV